MVERRETLDRQGTFIRRTTAILVLNKAKIEEEVVWLGWSARKNHQV